MRYILSIALLASVASCATPPDRIAAIHTSNVTCTPIDAKRLNDLSEEQGKMARNDALGVFMIGLPVGSMGKADHKNEIALLKGRCG